MEKFAYLREQLEEQFGPSATLETRIRENLMRLARAIEGSGK